MVYNYTKARGPIAAMYRSPGPCHELPTLVGHRGHDPRSVHERGRTWYFGNRHNHALAADSSPGPVHYPDVRLTREGLNGAPHFSMLGRQKETKNFDVPAPGAYFPEKAGPSSCPHAPVFSFGSRTNHRSKDPNPAPNRYSLPNMLGKTIESSKRAAPAFSQTGRSQQGSFAQDLSKTPGPGTYTVTNPDKYQDKRPAYSLTSRHVAPGDNTMKPGPGAHNAEDVTINKRQAPRHTFGIRHSQYVTPLIIAVDD